MSLGLSHKYNNMCYIQCVTGNELKNARKASSWTQAQAAARLGVTQAYLSMVERGERAVSSELASRAVEVFEVPATALPLSEYRPRAHNAGFFQAMLGSLGYPGFAYLRSSLRLNPVELLMDALDSDDLDSRVTEALAWLPPSGVKTTLLPMAVKSSPTGSMLIGPIDPSPTKWSGRK